MRVNLSVVYVGLIFLAVSFFMPQDAGAIPAFSRQTGMACSSCHFQHFPALNAFGRSFKAGGYTMTGGQSMIEGDFLSLPSVLNASLVTKIRFQKRNGGTDAGEAGELNKGSLQFPDEAALLLGGRVGEHAGFLLEAAIKEGEPLFTSFKLPFVFALGGGGTNISVVPFTTDGLGAAYGLELLNTGSLRHQRFLEHRTETSAQQYIGTATEATGLTFAAVNSLWFANYTLWANEHPAETGNSISSGPYLHYARLAFTPTFAGWDLGFGGQVWGGVEKNLEDGVVTRKKAEAWAIDAQAQGGVGALPVGVYLTYGKAPSSSDDPNIFNETGTGDKSAWTVAAEVGVIAQKLTVAAVYRDGNSGAAGDDTDDATTLGVVYTPIQNLQVQLDHTWYTGDGGPTPDEGNNLTTLMLFAAF